MNSVIYFIWSFIYALLLKQNWAGFVSERVQLTTLPNFMSFGPKAFEILSCILHGKWAGGHELSCYMAATI